jgi:hypothetical protein
MKRQAPVFRAAWALALPLLHRQIFSAALLCEEAEIPARLAMRYRRWPTLLLLPLLWGSVSAISFLSEKDLSSFVTLRLLILRVELRLVPFPGLQTRLHRDAKHCRQELHVFLPTRPSMFLPLRSEIFSVLGRVRHVIRFARIHRAGFFPRR